MCFTCFPCVFFLSSFLTQCRPLSVSMGNAIKYLKLQITHTPPDMAEDQVNLHVCLLLFWLFSRVFFKAVSEIIKRERFPPRSKDFFFTSCGSLIPFTRANAQWVIHGFI